ncbi:hypothetical protein OH76DRAFT_60860 [Lentinus brumalis]|uniref:Transmembrane protein n=1 Tax=Lentinus brumalis TaxID=2498619 RepID=A0A371DKE0_9APHY|nr:hypothetical protein OH76DRAFT_60860 [Polyporus brumalis]
MVFVLDPPGSTAHRARMVVLGRSVLAIAVLLQWTAHRYVAQAGEFDLLCTPKHLWMVNSEGQTPCYVAAYLNIPCAGPDGSVVVPMSRPDMVYTANDGICECNPLLYALFQACQACQFENGTVVIKYSEYTHNCTQNNLRPSYPKDIPSGTAVPAWAYQNVTSKGLFNLTTASAVAAQGHPDTIGSASPLVTIVSTTTYIYPFATTLSPSATGASSSSSSSEFVVPLVGGVVGGVVGLVLLGCLAVFLRGRSKLRSMSAPHEQAARFVSPGIYPASPEWVYEPWSPMSSTVTVLNSPAGTRTYSKPYPFAGLGQSSSAGNSPTTRTGQSGYHAIMSYTGAAEL